MFARAIWQQRKTRRVSNARPVKPPLCKGRWHGVSRDGGIGACADELSCIRKATIPQSASLTAPFTQGGLQLYPHRVYLAPECRAAPPTNHRKAATNNRNFASSHRRVLAPGRGQCVRSWILKGALAKRSRKARTQAPLSRAPRLGSSGTFLLLFWSQKRRIPGGRPLKKDVAARWQRPIAHKITSTRNFSYTASWLHSAPPAP